MTDSRIRSRGGLLVRCGTVTAHYASRPWTRRHRLSPIRGNRTACPLPAGPVLFTVLSGGPEGCPVKGRRTVVNIDQTEPAEVVDRLLRRDAQRILDRHAEPDREGLCVWCAREWPCAPRRLAERTEAAA